jgi:hypothetical protein
MMHLLIRITIQIIYLKFEFRKRSIKHHNKEFFSTTIIATIATTEENNPSKTAIFKVDSAIVPPPSLPETTKYSDYLSSLKYVVKTPFKAGDNLGIFIMR